MSSVFTRTAGCIAAASVAGHISYCVHLIWPLEFSEHIATLCNGCLYVKMALMAAAAASGCSKPVASRFQVLQSPGEDSSSATMQCFPIPPLESLMHKQPAAFVFQYFHQAASSAKGLGGFCAKALGMLSLPERASAIDMFQCAGLVTSLNLSPP